MNQVYGAESLLQLQEGCSIFTYGLLGRYYSISVSSLLLACFDEAGLMGSTTISRVKVNNVGYALIENGGFC